MIRFFPFALLIATPALAALPEYDAAISADPLQPTSRLGNAVTFNGTNSAPFNFGSISGDATFEFIVAGTTAAPNGYLAVGANATSNLRFEQWFDTNQLGMTQLGVADYLFSPPVASPVQITHITYVWNGTDTMRLFVNGLPVSSATGITPAFGMPSGQGRLGANPSNGEGMTGTVYRMTCFDSVLPDATILNHADAFTGIRRPPVISSFTASPPAALPGQSVTLAWSTTSAASLTLNGADVSAVTSFTTPLATTTTFTLTATNPNGSAAATLTVPVIQPAGHVVISEFMAENKSTLADATGAFPDWLELHNPTASPVSLDGFFLTDDPANLRRWPLPTATLNPGAYQLIFLSGRTETPPTGSWHADFRLSKAGEFLALTDGTQTVHAFAPAFPPQDEDVSYGLTGGDPGLAGFMARPTPGTANDPTPPRPGRVRFSEPAGLLAAPLSVTLTADTPDATIRYQLNGNPEILTYSAPLAVSQSTRVTAWSERFGQRSDPVRAAWLRPGASLAGYQSNLPIMVIDNFGSGPIPQKGWSGTGAGITQVPQQNATWVAWDRTAGGSATVSGPPQLHSQIAIRGRGAFSSSWRQKPYAVEAVSETGSETDVPVLGMPAHADWILYYPDTDSNKDPSLLFNTFMYQLARECGHDAPRFRWVELFVNEDGGDPELTDRRGVYAVIEKVARGPQRLAFQKLSDDGTSGGWILSINRMDAIPETGFPAANGATSPQFFRTAGPNRILQTKPNNPAVVGDDLPQQSNGFLNFENPGGYRINPAQRSAIEGWFKSFEDVLYSTSWRDPVNGYRRWLDDRDFAEYFVFNEISRNGDGMLISMFPWKGDDGRLRMGPAWDYNWSSYHIGGAATGNFHWRSNQIWYARLFTDPDFLQLYIDRWFAFRRGPMSNSGMNAIIDAQAAEITAAKAMLNGVASPADFTSRLNAMKSWLSQRGDWVDSNYLRVPIIPLPSGIVPAGTTVRVLTTSGLPRSTTTTAPGSDPRLPGGAPLPSALTASIFTISSDTRLTSRAYISAASRYAANWSAPTTALYVTDAIPAIPGSLAISEIHYHPAPPTPAESAAGFTDADDFEFLEITSTATSKLSLLGLSIPRNPDGSGIQFSFDDSAQLSLAPSQSLVLVRNPTAFALRYGSQIPIAGTYSGRLSNSGESITITNPASEIIASVSYADNPPWPTAADGSGYSLTWTGQPPHLPQSWRSSVNPGGSPTTTDRIPLPSGSDLLAYALASPHPAITTGKDALTLTWSRLPGRDDVSLTPESSADLSSWSPLDPNLSSEIRSPNGSFLLQSSLPLSPQTRFIRLRARQP